MKNIGQSKAHNAYSKNELLLNHLVEGVKDYAIFMLDENGKVASWNSGAGRIKGYRSEEIIGKHFSCFYTKEDIKNGKPEHALKTAIQEGRFEDNGWRVRKNGSLFWASVIITPLYDEDCIFQGFTKITRDITEQKKSEERFRGILEAAPDAIVIADDRGKIMIVNAQTEALFGYNRNELNGMEVEDLMPERFRGSHYHHRDVYNVNPKVRSMGVGLELYARRKDGSEFPVEISLSPVEIQGEGFSVFAAVRDITRQKKAESEIRNLNEELDKRIEERTSELNVSLQKEKIASALALKNQERLVFLSKVSEILSSSLDYLKTLSGLAKLIAPGISDWCIFHEVRENGKVNPLIIEHKDQFKINVAYEIAKKYPLDPVVTKGLYKVIRTRKPEFYAHIPDKLLEAYAISAEHLQIIRQLHIRSVISVPLIIRDMVYGIMTLVLEGNSRQFDNQDLELAKEIGRRTSVAIENGRLYQEAQNLNAELEQRVIHRTAELEAINKELESFSYSVSHDLRAPLRSIDGFSNLILKKYSQLLDEQGQDYFSRVIHASQQMGILIDDLLKLARLSRIEMNRENTNLSEVAEGIATDLKSSVPERNAKITIQPNLVANADKHLIQIALHNLFENAWKYSRNQPITEITFGAMVQEGKSTFFIRDNGVGFDMKYVDKLFGAFQRLHSTAEFEGTGIGLATVQRIIRRHLGRIWAEGEVDKGAIFYFTL